MTAAGASRGDSPLHVVPGAAIAGLSASDPGQVIRALAARLLAGGHVTPSFADAAVERERSYPTGLPTAIPSAIPHTDPEHVLHPGIAVATLPTPVTFKEMGSSNRTVDVRLVVMLALKGSDDQLSALQALVGMLQDAPSVAELLEAHDDADLARRVRVWTAG